MGFEPEDRRDERIIKILVVLIILGLLIIIGLTLAIIIWNSVGYHGPTDKQMEDIFCPWPGGCEAPPPGMGPPNTGTTGNPSGQQNYKQIFETAKKWKQYWNNQARLASRVYL
uniref:Uncharacterized protein n=1 Tax=Acrobeloides nanus TaxID=290746 RepID=A0A914EEQ4_9BILA